MKILSYIFYHISFYFRKKGKSEAQKIAYNYVSAMILLLFAPLLIIPLFWIWRDISYPIVILWSVLAAFLLDYIIKRSLKHRKLVTYSEKFGQTNRRSKMVGITLSFIAVPASLILSLMIIRTVDMITQLLR